MFLAFPNILTYLFALTIAVNLFALSNVAKAADCATFPSRIAIHHGFELSSASQLELMKALKFDCREDLSLSDISGVIETILTKNNIVVDDVEPFTISDDGESPAEDVLNFLISTPSDNADTKTVILPMTLTNRPISDFVNFATLNGEPKVGEELVLRFALEAQVAAQFNARPFISWKRDGKIIPEINAARYQPAAKDSGAIISAELRLENPRGDILSVQEYAAIEPVKLDRMPPQIIGLQLNGTPQEGQVLTVRFDLDQGLGNEAGVRPVITWRRDGVEIEEAKGVQYRPRKTDIGKTISVEVVPEAVDGLRGISARAELAQMIAPRPMAKGQKAPSLSMADIKVDDQESSKETSQKAATPSQSLTVEKVVTEENKRLQEEAKQKEQPKEESVKVAPPPVKPDIVTAEKAEQAEPSVSVLQDKLNEAKSSVLAALEDKIADKDGLNIKPEPEPEPVLPRGPLIKDLPKHLNGDRAPIDCFKLETINLENSTVMDNASRDMLLGSFIERCTTPELIGSIMEALNNFYIDEGYVTTRAYVAPQDLRDGSLDIVIVEGLIEKIQFDNTTDLTTHRVDLAFPVKPGDVLNINSLERGLDQLNVPASNKVTMNMIPGTKPGYSIIDLEEEKIGSETRIKIGLDNMGSQGTGEDRLTLGVDMDHILGLSDTWSISHIGSLDTNALAANVTIPSGDWTFTASYSYSDYLNYIDEATQLFGKSETTEVKADRLIYKADGNELSLKSSLNKKTSKRTIGDVKLKSQNMSVGRIGFGFSRKSTAVFSGNVYLAKGLKFFGAESDGQGLSQDTPRAQFTKVQFDASYYRPVFKQIFLQSALAGQVSGVTLYGSEQISAGGKSSVRGFARNTIAGDAGFYVQNDFLFPIPEVLLWGPLREYIAAIKPFVGFDYAYASDRASKTRNAIAGVGMGAKFAKGRFSGDFGIGIPIHRQSGSQGNRVEKYVKFLYEALEF